MEEGNKKLNTLVISIGLFLMLIVVFLTFLRPALHKNAASKNSSQATSNFSEQVAPKISSKELFQKLMTGEPLNILDIRPQNEFAKKHMLNSKNVTPENIANIIEKDKFYIIIDDGNSGLSRNLAASLKSSTASNVFYLEGGFQEWNNSNFPTISEGDSTSITDQSKVSFITPDDLKTAIQENGAGLLLIDVRNPDIFSFEHLKNALNMPLSDIEKRASEINSGKQIIVYDNSGTTSFQAAVRFFDLNVFNVYILSGGLDAWKQKGFEITK